MDKLQECAKSFEKLLDKKYHIIIGRKGKSTDFTVEFSPLDFHHLMG
ncbi:MAG: PBECR4 domain-containing protein, partial [Oscillospiraceae bacterium]